MDKARREQAFRKLAEYAAEHRPLAIPAHKLHNLVRSAMILLPNGPCTPDENEAWDAIDAILDRMPR